MLLSFENPPKKLIRDSADFFKNHKTINIRSVTTDINPPSTLLCNISLVSGWWLCSTLLGGHLLLLSEVATSCSCWPTGQKLQLLITTCWDWPSWDWPGWWPTCWSCSNCATKQVSQQMIPLISISWDLWMDHLFHDPDKKKCSYVLASTPPTRLVSCWLMGVSGCGRRRTNADLKLLIYAFLKVGLFLLFLIICQSFSSTNISITIVKTIITLVIFSLINVLIYLWMNLSNSTRLRSIIVASRSTTKPI